MNRPAVSVCIVAGRDAAALDICLESLTSQADAPSFEVLVADNASRGATPTATRRFPGARIIATPDVLPGAARNPLIRAARGDLLLFLDDDVIAPPTLLRHLVTVASRYPDTVVFGGPNDTPPGSTAFQVVQGAVLASVMGSGPVCRRYGARRAGSADERWFTLCNLAVRRAMMVPFLDDLACAEENAVLAELHRRGAAMRYEPELVVFHERRVSPSAFARQMYKYGRGRGALMRRDAGTIRLAFLAPSALLAYALVLVLLSGLGALTLAATVPAAVYAALTLATAVRVSWSVRRPAAAVVAPMLILMVHACYGLGVLRGLTVAPPRPTTAVAAAKLPGLVAGDPG